MSRKVSSPFVAGRSGRKVAAGSTQAVPRNEKKALKRAAVIAVVPALLLTGGGAFAATATAATTDASATVSTASAAVTVALPASADTYVSSKATGTNYGSTNEIALSRFAYHGLMRFNMSALPAGSTISSATLKLYSDQSLAGSYVVSPESDSWSEKAVTSANQPAWNSTVLATSSALQAGAYASAALPTRSIPNRGNVDFGLSTTAGLLAPVESRESSHAPQLVVTYVPPAAAPAPAVPSSTAARATSSPIAPAVGPVTYTQTALSATVNGSSVSASTAMTASVPSAVQAFKVCVRSASGANLDFGTQNATLSPTPTTLNEGGKTFDPGTYSYWGCFVKSDGSWFNGVAKTFTVGAATPTTSAPPTRSSGPTTPTSPTPPPSTGAPTSGSTPVPPLKPLGVPGTWKEVFGDEFNGTSLDRSRWVAQEGGHMNKVITHASNVSVSGGNLVLTLASSSSGAMISSSKADGAGANGYLLPVGGFVEARVYFPGNGSSVYNWPAWWTSGPGWPAAGENDIAEGLGTLTVNYHSPTGSHNHGTVAGTWTNGFHVYGVYRKAHSSDVYYDGVLVRSYPTDDNGGAQSLLVNVGDGNTHVYGVGSQVKVDYIRAYLPA